jgi:DNA-binding MarR family transcriptional regulator
MAHKTKVAGCDPGHSKTLTKSRRTETNPPDIRVQERLKAELWAPVPARAISDERLTLTHFRTLAAIALHDRMSGRRKTGQGCWASHKTLAQMCDVNYNNLSTAISELGRWGYITRQSHPLNKRQHVYRVIYETSPSDEQSVSNEPDVSSPTGEVLDTQTLAKASASDRKSTSTLRQEKTETQQDQLVGDVEYIPLKREKILQKQERYSVETASLRDVRLRNGKSTNIGGFLAITERELQEGTPLDRLTRQKLQEIADDPEAADDSNCQRAQRLLDTYEPE